MSYAPSPDRSASTNSLFCRTSSDWLQYFQFNQKKLLTIPWDSLYQLTAQERATISQSICKFQFGASSHTTHLLRQAHAYAIRVGDPDWVEVVRLFIKEEQRHAMDLAHFMQQQQILPTKRHGLDTLFRLLRRLANLELALTMLFTAELIATIYFEALAVATRSPVLKQLCNQILQDDAEHIRFQAESLAKLRQAHPQWVIRLFNWIHQVFFHITIKVMWFEHRLVLQVHNDTFSEFSRTAHCTLKAAYQMIQT
jgi:hypothetical protein